MRALRAQVRHELASTLGHGESLLLTLGIPLGFLLFFSKVDVITYPVGGGSSVDFVAPGVMALAVMSSAMVSLSISVGFERSYGVLTRLQATPLGRGRLVLAKLLALLAVEAIQLTALGLVALGLGWSPRPGYAAAVLAVVLATGAFGGLALCLAGRLEGVVNLAVSNALYLVLLMTSGMVVPLDKLGGVLGSLSPWLPAGALAEVLHEALGGQPTGVLAWATLSAWGLLAPLAAVALFRFEPNR